MRRPPDTFPAPSRSCGRRILQALLLLAWGTAFLAAQPLAFRRFDDRDGLPQSQVYAILEDRDGFLWMGTQEGVARLGASGFRVFGPSQGLAPTQVSHLIQDRAGSVWVAGSENGLAEIRGSRVRNYGEADGLTDSTFYCLLERRNGELLAGARQGLYLKRGTRFQRVELPGAWSYLPVFGMAEGADGSLWLGSRQGNLARWDGRRMEPAVLPKALAEKPVQTLQRGPDGDLWALFPNMLLRKRVGGGWEPFPLPGPAGANFSSLAFTPQGELLVGMGSDGILLRRPDGHVQVWTYRDGLPREGVATVLRDRRGVLWIGTEGADVLAQVVPGLRSISVDPETGAGLGMGSMAGFLELAPGRVLMGGSGGLFLWEDGKGITNRWTKAPGAPVLDVWALLPHPRGGAWVACTKGLFWWREGRVEPGPERIRNVVINSVARHQGRLWVSSIQEGLIELSEDGRFIAQHALPQEVGRSAVPKVLPRPWERGLLVATRLGLYTFRSDDSGRGLFRRAYAGSPVETADISMIHEDPSGMLWVGTTRGLYGFQKGRVGQAKHLGELDGIFGTPNWILRIPGGPLAVGHAKGVSLVADSGTVLLTKNRGLLSDETTTDAAMLDSRGRLWIGMKTGVSILDTSLPVAPTSLPPPRVMEVLWGTESRWLPERLDIPPSPGSLDFVFDTGLPASPVAPRYQVMIEGLDSDWRLVEANANSTQVANIGPGHYRFRLRASLDGRAWVESAPLPFRVKPAWYQWAIVRVLFVLMGAGLVALAVYLRLRALERQARLLEAKVEERTEMLGLRNKSLERVHHQLKRSLEGRVQLMRTVSHDLRSPLTSIMLSVDRLREADRDTPSDGMLKVLDREARRMEAIIRGLLDQARSESFTDGLNLRLCRPSEVLEGLTDTLRLKAEARSLSPELALEPAVGGAWILADATALQQVLFNLIENALKFTDPPGKVGIRSFLREDTWVLEVWDTGRGIDPEHLEDIFQPFRQTREGDRQEGWGLGLNICRTMVEAHSGRIEVSSEVGAGSTFRVVLPRVMPSQHPQQGQG